MPAVKVWGRRRVDGATLTAVVCGVARKDVAGARKMLWKLKNEAT